jgi:glutamate--cysteine ligase catalytic subunit
MGYLIDTGTAFNWEETKELGQFLREKGLKQLVALFKKFRHHKNKELLCGDEIESHVFNKNEYIIEGDFDLRLRNLSELNQQLEHCDLTTEFGSWMIEYTPKRPFSVHVLPSEYIEHLGLRKKEIKAKVLGEDEHLLATTVVPNMGVGKYYRKHSMTELLTEEERKSRSYNQATASKIFDDTLITYHPRYAALVRNIRTRRGENVFIKVPIYRDEKTIVTPTEEEPFAGLIHGDACAFGTGNACFQMTFNSRDLEHARHLYDQFVVFAPIAVYLTTFHSLKVM